MAAYATDAVNLASAAPGTPASGYGVVYVDPTSAKVSWKDSGAVIHHMTSDLGGTPATADQSITATSAPGTLIAGSSAAFAANSVSAGLIARTTIILTYSTTSVAAQFAVKFGTTGTSSDATIISPNAITALSTTVPIRIIFEVVFRSATTAYWNHSGVNNTTNLQSIGGALSGLTTTSGTFLTFFIASASAQTITVHQCYTEVLSQ